MPLNHAELKPCPFCGGVAHYEPPCIACQSCGIRLSLCGETWNRRALPPGGAEAVVWRPITSCPRNQFIVVWVPASGDQKAFAAVMAHLSGPDSAPLNGWFWPQQDGVVGVHRDNTPTRWMSWPENEPNAAPPSPPTEALPWRPMESAPRDGTEIVILWRAYEEDKLKAQNVAWQKDGSYTDENEEKHSRPAGFYGTNGGLYVYGKCWMPIPSGDFP